jgi:hypothetical protein
MNRTVLFQYLRANPFGGRLSQAQVDGINATLDIWERYFRDGDRRHLAYGFATEFHETGQRMQPVRETFASSDAEAIRILDRAYDAGRLPQVRERYWEPDENGQSWFGRGPVQLTHKENYEKMRQPVLDAFPGVDIVFTPDAVLTAEVGSFILFEGMLRGATGRGDFTGYSLEQFFSASIDDPVGARRVVNGQDRASLIATYYEAFLAAINAAMDAASTSGPLHRAPDPEAAQPDDRSVWRDPGTMIATGAATAGPIVSQVLGGVNTVAGAVVLVMALIIAASIFVWLVKSGRLSFNKPGRAK